MKIKRYMAESMRAALAQVRAEQGPDAVILSSRRVAEGIEVIAAVDYDEALFAGATQKRTSVAAAENIEATYRKCIYPDLTRLDAVIGFCTTVIKSGRGGNGARPENEARDDAHKP